MSQVSQKNGQKLKYIDLFAGVGGFSLALERAGHECVYANDIDKYCKIIYDKNFETKLDNRSITDVTAEEIPDHELLVGGFPCQSFSIAGKRGGFDDTRGTLFFEVARIAQQKQPRLFILENVKGLLSHDKGQTFATIINTLDELGYDLQWQVLNSKDFGVPQNRERVFIVGHLRGTPRPKVFPIREKTNVASKPTESTEMQVASTLAGSGGHIANGEYKGMNLIEVKYTLSSEKWDKFNESSRRVYDTDGIAPTIPTVAGGGHTPKIDVSETIADLASEGLEITEKGYESLLKASGVKIRKLTPLECERLQGFPDGWTDGVSDTQRYKMMGNAVTVNVVEAIIKSI